MMEMEPKAILMNGRGLGLMDLGLMEMEPKALLMNGHVLDGDGAQSYFNEWTWAWA